MTCSRLIFGLFAAALLVTGCALGPDTPASGAAYTNLTAQQLSDLLQAEDVFLVNTHIPYEGEIEATDAFIAYDETEPRLDEYPEAKDAKIVLYCRSGRMSAISADALARAGYTNLWNLDGGMIAWEAAGLPLLHR